MVSQYGPEQTLAHPLGKVRLFSASSGLKLSHLGLELAFKGLSLSRGLRGVGLIPHTRCPERLLSTSFPALQPLTHFSQSQTRGLHTRCKDLQNLVPAAALRAVPARLARRLPLPLSRELKGCPW